MKIYGFFPTRCIHKSVGKLATFRDCPSVLPRDNRCFGKKLIGYPYDVQFKLKVVQYAKDYYNNSRKVVIEFNVTAKFLCDWQKHAAEL